MNVKLKRPVGGGNFWVSESTNSFKKADLFNNEASVLINYSDVSVLMNVYAHMQHYLRYYDPTV